MTTKERIADGEAIIAENNNLLENIELIEANYDHEIAVRLLLSLQKTATQKLNASISEKLKKLKKDYVSEFEIASAECNANMERLIDACNKIVWEKKGIPAIREAMPPLINDYAANKHKMSQEDKNTIYFTLKQHFEVLNSRANPTIR